MPESRITTNSSNASVVVGASTSFQCSTDSDLNIRWYFCGVLDCDDEPKVIYNGQELDPTRQSRFTVAPASPVGSRLNITDVEVDDSGTYICAEADAFENNQQRFTLDVLGNLLVRVGRTKL